MKIGKPKESGPRIRKGKDDGSVSPLKLYYRASYDRLDVRRWANPPWGWNESKSEAIKAGIADKKERIAQLKLEISALRRLR